MIFIIVCHWQLFRKAGHPGWASIIPFYNNYVLSDIAFGSGFLFLLLFIPIVNFVFIIIMYIKLSSAFGKGAGFACGMIFLAPVFLPILAFDNSVYRGPQ
jgi:Na+/melibiose symporter-like transporter